MNILLKITKKRSLWLTKFLRGGKNSMLMVLYFFKPNILTSFAITGSSHSFKIFSNPQKLRHFQKNCFIWVACLWEIRTKMGILYVKTNKSIKHYKICVKRLNYLKFILSWKIIKKEDIQPSKCSVWSHIFLSEFTNSM